MNLLTRSCDLWDSCKVNHHCNVLIIIERLLITKGRCVSSAKKCIFSDDYDTRTTDTLTRTPYTS